MLYDRHKEKAQAMMHKYEIRKLEKDEKVTIIRQFTAEPKSAKKTFKEYAEKNSGIYSLYKVQRVGIYFAEEGKAQ